MIPRDALAHVGSTQEIAVASLSFIEAIAVSRQSEIKTKEGPRGNPNHKTLTSPSPPTVNEYLKQKLAPQQKICTRMCAKISKRPIFAI